MYRSKDQIEKKIAQAKYTLKEIQKYRGKIFVNDGIDLETRANPLQVKTCSFLSITRSVLQYAYKEAKEKDMLSAYENSVNKQLIFNVFKNLRNTDIHEMTIGTHIYLHLYSPINFTKNPIKPEAAIREENKKRSAERKLVHQISRPLASNNNFIDKLRNAGQTDLADAAVAGKTLYESVEFEGEADMFILCEKYLADLCVFVAEMADNEVVT